MTNSASLYDLFLARLQTARGIDVYDGEPPASPPYDDDGRVHAYAVLYGAGGSLYASSLDRTQSSLQASFQVTCVGGDMARCLACVDAVRAVLPGPVTVDGVARRICEIEEDPGPIRTDFAVWPPRHYVPLEYELYAP